MTHRRIPRRLMLRGAGSVAILLPFLEEMHVPVARADVAARQRLITLFFGLGLDPSWQHDFAGPLEPFEPLASKMAFFSANMGQGQGGGAHCETSAVVFVGEKQKDVNLAGGPSIDQLLRSHLGSTAPTLVSGLWWRRGACDAQANRVYDETGNPRPPLKRPSEVFDALFGTVMPPAPPSGSADEEAAKRALRSQRSILDTVLGEYQSLVSERSYLGASSKRKIEQHLSSIREIESQLAPADGVVDGMDDPSPACTVPAAPEDPDIGVDYDRFTYGTGDASPALDWQDFQRVFRLHADLWALGLRCDRVRFGNLAFESAGGHTNLTGTYTALGQSTDFPGTSQHDSYFHDNKPFHARLYQHFSSSNLAYFLQLLDDPEHLEENGNTVLDNSCVVIGTEYGWNHSKQKAFHAVAGGGGRFRPGFYTDKTINCIDLYNAILQGYDVDAKIGEATGVDSEGSALDLLA